MISARPPNAASGRPPPTILPRSVRSGSDAVALLRAAARDAEARDHLVEDEQRAGRVAERAQRLEEARLGGTTPMFPATGSTMIAASLAVLGDGRGDRVDVVVRHDDRVVRATPPARRALAGMPSVATPEPALDEQRVGVAVVAAGELEDPVARRERRGQGAPRSSRPRCPDETSRTFSIDGQRGGDLARPARPRASVGAPNVVPRARPRATASIVAGSAWPRISGPQDMHPVDVAVAVDVLEVGALAAPRRRTVVDARRRASRGPAS